MRMEIVNDTAGPAQSFTFPPSEDHVDLRENPHAIEQIAPARQYLPLRNFLTAVNSPGSVFASVMASVECDVPGDASNSDAYLFASQTTLVFAVSSLNFDPGQYTELTANLKELLERDSGEAVRGELRISPCNFPEQNQRGFCLCVRLVATGDSAKQAELRWGLGLARVQQALMFRARLLGQQIGA